MSGLLRFDAKQILDLTAALKPSDPVVLVGDHGVYIMSVEGPKKDDGSAKIVVYAEGCNPETDEDYYDNKRDIFGGDDGVEDIGTALEIARLAKVAKKSLLVKLTATRITMVPR